MSFLRKIIVASMVIFFLGIWIQSSYAKVSSPCSSTKRQNIQTRTYEKLYPWLYKQQSTYSIGYLEKAGKSLPKATDSIAWEEFWHNNFVSTCNNWLFLTDEKSNWEAWRTPERLKSAWVTNAISNVSIDDVVKLQQYINKECALGIAEDWGIGVQTINAVNYCMPPAKWDMTMADFSTHKGNLFSDPTWKTPIINTGTKLIQSDPTTTLYFDKTKSPTLQEKWAGLKASTSESSQTTTCSFAPPVGITPDQVTSAITDYKSNHNDYSSIDIQPGSCTSWCNKWYIEKKISVWTGEVVVCEACSLELCNCGIKLNTNVPFIGRCIMNKNTNAVWQKNGWTVVSPLTAFPLLMGALIKFLMSVIMIVCFASLIVGWFMMTIPDQYETGKWLVKKVIRTIISLWTIWTILYLINPNFFL